MKNLSEKRALELLGKQIRKFREGQNVSQNQLAYEAEIALRQLGRIERGEINTSFYVLYKICKALNISLPQLLSFLDD